MTIMSSHRYPVTPWSMSPACQPQGQSRNHRETARATVLTRFAGLLALSLALSATASAEERSDPDPAGQPLDLRGFRPVDGPSSGPEVYYEVIEESGETLVRGRYGVGMEAVTMGLEVPESLRDKARWLQWRWRVRALPAGGDECRPGYGDSPAQVFVTYKRGLKWYILRYVWSSVGPRNAICDRKRTLTLARDTIVLESGPGSGEWVNERIDVRAAFLRHFGKGGSDEDVPDLVGVGIRTDGDQTRSESSADWAGFEVLWQ